jgi:SAM-dependent methyltransferase
MRRVMRAEANETYWDRRWREAGRDAGCFDDINVYPIRFAEMIMRDRDAEVLELGVGLGRVMKHYHQHGFRMRGIEKSDVALAQLRADCPELDVRAGDVRELPFASNSFDVILAFGVYHNIEKGMDDAVAETARCLKAGGRFCISMRPDNVEMRLNELYWRWHRRRSGASRSGGPQFHKWLVRAREFKRMLARHGLSTDEVHYARNVSLLYRVPILRAKQKDESVRRAQGYRLNVVGRAIDALTMVMPSQRANAIVFIGKKVGVPQEDRAQREVEFVEVKNKALRREREIAPVSP